MTDVPYADARIERDPVEGIDHVQVVQCLTTDLRDVYDSVLGKTLPIYFGPLLGELFLVDF